MTDPDIQEQENEKPTHPIVDKVNEINAYLKGLTSKKETDNVWVLGVKYFFKGLMILILILLSPFAAIAILISAMVAG
jgi:hypothetical protein